MNLIPLKASYLPSDPIGIELKLSHSEEDGKYLVQLWHLDTLISERVSADHKVVFDSQKFGGYGVKVLDPSDKTRCVGSTSIDVLNTPFERPRYGFVAEFSEGRSPELLARTARKLHLNMIQFYDWAFKYAQLVPDTDKYLDPLNRELSLATVRGMTSALANVGSKSMGYAAVYAVGGTEWDQWKDAGLFKTDGQPHRFTDDLLLVVDPSNEKWMEHFTSDLSHSMQEVGFDGFHLDSYGWPKKAFRSDGTICDLNHAFSNLLARIRRNVPDSSFMFNNVNDFPTWSTTQTDQDATYIEVWAPHTALRHLGLLIDRARACRPGFPPILAAYLSVYSKAPVSEADDAARLVMATIFSHGGTHLLNGEDDVVLVDPYYPKNHKADESTIEMMRNWYDFHVRYGDLLLAPEAIDVTRSYTGGINEDLIFATQGGQALVTDPEPDAVWVRVVSTDLGLVVHLINLIGQEETDWDRRKNPIPDVKGLRLRMLKTLGVDSPYLVDPEQSPWPQHLDIRDDGSDYLEIDIPDIGAWAMVVLPNSERWKVV
ncbi:MAG TPA: glycoside hydrolase family 66 protein [Candidatus Paceibacterota bacterium]|nr:glycoside hydrolase family 66 protein [Candidatus Paceibacterota bacterium]